MPGIPREGVLVAKSIPRQSQAMQTFFIRWGVYCVVGFFLSAAIIATAVLRCFQISLPELGGGVSLIGPKLTFLSVVIALGIVQYNYFYQETREIRRNIEERDFGPAWRNHVRQIDQLRALLAMPNVETRVQSAQLQSLQGSLDRAEAEIRRTTRDYVTWLNRSLVDFAFRLGMVLSIALILYSSLAVDVVLQIWKISTPTLDVYSQVAFIITLGMATFYLFFLVYIIQSNFRLYHSIQPPADQ
jgi:hypothetical protein